MEGSAAEPGATPKAPRLQWRSEYDERFPARKMTNGGVSLRRWVGAEETARTDENTVHAAGLRTSAEAPAG
ncbi:hypothetical protein DB347_20080 [Opitutaceae bacterium EW11]|nr:hypothetical protein DB347_20080 [Opitutaceae bacterium EW11]